VAQGKTVDQALGNQEPDIVAAAELPPVKIHCSVLAEDAIRPPSPHKKKQVAEARRRKQPAAGRRNN